MQIASSFTIAGTSAAVSVGNLGFTHGCALTALGSQQCRLLVPTGNIGYLPFHSQNGNCAEVLQLPGFTPHVRHTEAWKNILQELLEVSKVGPDDLRGLLQP